MFAATKVLLWQIFVATKVTLVCRDKTGLLSQPKYACWDKHVFVALKLFLRQKYFVATNIILSKQKLCRGKHTFVATKNVCCHDKHVLVMTKMILVAAPTNDKSKHLWCVTLTWILEQVARIAEPAPTSADTSAGTRRRLCGKHQRSAPPSQTSLMTSAAVPPPASEYKATALIVVHQMECGTGFALTGNLKYLTG